MPRNIIHSDVSVDPESESEALSIAPDAEDEPEEEDEEGEGEIEVDVEEEDEDGEERDEGEDGDEEEVDEPEEEDEDEEPADDGDGDAVQEVRTAAFHTAVADNLLFSCPNSQTSMNSHRPPSPHRQRRRCPPARHDSRSRSNFPLRHKNSLGCVVSSIRRKTRTATSSLRKMTMTTNTPVVERENDPSLHVKPCWPASSGPLMFH